MEITTDSVRRLVEHCRRLVDAVPGERPPIGYPASLALCLIDAIYATGSHPTAVAHIIARYVARHGCVDGAKSLRYSIAAAGGSRAWAETVAHNLKPANTHPGAPLKAEVVNRATRLMADLDIETVPDLLSAVAADPTDNAVIRAWRTLPSQSSAVTYFHLLALAGSDHLQPDRAVLRHLTEVVADGDAPDVGDLEASGVGGGAVPPDVGDSVAPDGGTSPVDAESPNRETLQPDVARELIAEAAGHLGLGTGEVGRLIWQVAHRRIVSVTEPHAVLAEAKA
ncbi:hypothetical protein [Brevibacterium sp. XM4083]|uniref:hypothetical protein n=1 Tax=Brevibacterium sp. XM4083 TaxID=2583238 RepID=UPI001129DBC2|nr:hypothetical protein [Brevibacterium sp. XM4083]MCM1011334.1 hypothetical protein [Brevibacterium sp. XM4083]